MPPRLPLPALLRAPSTLLPRVRTYASIAHAPAAAPPIARRAATQPESHKAASTRKTQLHRTYLSLIRSSPLLIIFQHNNLRAVEWSALRRELKNALTKLDAASAPLTTINLVRPALFSSVLRVAEGFDKEHRFDNGLAGTSKEAYKSTLHLKETLDLHPLLTANVATLSMPVVAPAQLKLILELMFPEKRSKKGLDPLALSGLQKLVLLGARVDGHVAGGRIGEGRVLDGDQLRALSQLKSVEEMRGELAAILQSVGGGELVRSLGSVGLTLTRTVDGRRKMLEEGASDGKPVEETKAE
ncbi:uncharacterized protein LAJ45_01320 [Morchella importuna]|uniref:Ribosomal protein L10 n=1 Tax=Morchella conica CCBAS932 TaxID=1392247 RepID=A0A3N4KF43_9PEZI|nr:uncharacterized protein LAJ45_01320 [Morchella importuna]KAH8154789.1 hypothetical protein LAJ45_01320 [Morchella importuna]RPB09154.1 hypothetical protein P167DRAFT_608259 [Morchella conica CCBAS932]